MKDKMTKTHYILIAFYLLFVKCEFPNDTEVWSEEKYSLCLINSNGENYKELREDGYEGAWLRFISNDTKLVILWSDDLYHYDIDSADLKFIKNLQLNGTRKKSLSPDCNFIALVASNGNGDDLYSFNIDGSNLRNLTNNPDIHERSPSFSADGNKIIFTTFSKTTDQTISFYDLEKDSIFEIISHPDDHRVVNPITYFWDPIFGKDSNYIYYIKNNESTSVVGDSLFLLNIMSPLKKGLYPTKIYQR